MISSLLQRLTGVNVLRMSLSKKSRDSYVWIQNSVILSGSRLQVKNAGFSGKERQKADIQLGLQGLSQILGKCQKRHANWCQLMWVKEIVQHKIPLPNPHQFSNGSFPYRGSEHTPGQTTGIWKIG